MLRFLCKNLVQNGRSISSRDSTNKNKLLFLCSSFSLQTQSVKSESNSSNPKSVTKLGLKPSSTIIAQYPNPNHVLLLLVKSNGYCTAIRSSSSICANKNNNNMGGEIKMEEADDDDCRQVETIKNDDDGGIVLDDDDITSYNKLIDLHFKQGDWLDAMQLFWKMQRKMLKLDEHTVTIMVNGLCNVDGGVQEAILILGCAKSEGLPINSVAHNCVIDRYCKYGMFYNAVQFFEDMVEVKDSLTYTTLVDGLCKGQYFDWASSVLLRSLEDGIKVVPSVQQDVLRGLGDSGLEREENKLKLAIWQARQET